MIFSMSWDNYLQHLFLVVKIGSSGKTGTDPNPTQKNFSFFFVIFLALYFLFCNVTYLTHPPIKFNHIVQLVIASLFDWLDFWTSNIILKQSIFYSAHFLSYIPCINHQTITIQTLIQYNASVHPTLYLFIFFPFLVIKPKARVIWHNFKTRPKSFAVRFSQSRLTAGRSGRPRLRHIPPQHSSRSRLTGRPSFT